MPVIRRLIAGPVLRKQNEGHHAGSSVQIDIGLVVGHTKMRWLSLRAVAEGCQALG